MDGGKRKEEKEKDWCGNWILIIGIVIESAILIYFVTFFVNKILN